MASALAIPLARSREVLIVQPSELSEDIIKVLEREDVGFEIWIECARGLLSHGRVEAYTRLLKELIKQVQRRRDNSQQTKFSHVQALCSLADLHQQQARIAKDPEHKRKLLAEANRLYFSAAKVDGQEMLPHLGLGDIALSNGDADTAEKEFTAAAKKKCNGKPSIAGDLALARLFFSKSKFLEALSKYRQALRKCPSCPPEVRLGIAACHLRLGDVSRAEAAYKRVLELDPGCTQALLGLAVMELAVGASAENTQHGSRMLAQAFREDPHNPYTLALLAHFSLQQGVAGAALRLAQAAKDRADPDDRALRAEVTTLLGRAHHAKGELADAMQCYKEALELEPLQPTARLAKAKLDAMRGDLRGAVDNLENLLDVRPHLTDALRILAPLCPRQYTGAIASPAAAHFKETAEREVKDAALWEMLGDVLSGSDPSGALSAYTTAINLHRKASNAAASASQENGGNNAAVVPARLLNNAAVLQLRSGNPAAASQLVSEAIASAVAGGLSDLGAQAQVTLGYNAARVREAAGDLKAAEAEYQALLAQFPQYSDCYLRLACIAKARGNIRGAEEWAQRAAEASGRSQDALALLAGLHLTRRDIPEAKRYLEELQTSVESTKFEPYARVALGNVHLYSIRPKEDLFSEDGKRRTEIQLYHALNLYRKVLDTDPGNIFAANGVGCVLAECGWLNEAKEVFLSVQEAAAGTDGFFRLPDAWINLAAVYQAMKEYGAAEHTYKNAMKRFPEVRDEARVQLYLAKAQYDGGRGEAALRTLCRTLHIAPRDFKVRFNLAYVQQQLGLGVLHDTKSAVGDATRVEKLHQALNRLRNAVNAYEALQGLGSMATGVKRTTLQAHIALVNESLQRGERLLQKATEEANAAATRLEANRAKLEFEANKRRMEERRRELEAEAVARAREQQAKEAAAKLERLKSEWKQGTRLAKAAAAGDASMVPNARQQAEQPDAAMEALFADEEDDDEYVPGQADSGDEGGAGGGEVDLGTAALLGTGLLSSDDDEDDKEFEVEDESDEGEKKNKKRKKQKDVAGGKKTAKGAGGKEKKSGRLKKRAREREGGAAVAGGVEDEDGDAAGNGVEEVEEDSPAKRARQEAVVFDDFDEEEEAPSTAKAAAADLFGSDSD